ncbi:MAG TPA: hypothetical protein VN541_07310 [Tepidisphaeraceae bacterium]|nr:hypothetical protein [Tepidisphaeraceae bacterium]
MTVRSQLLIASVIACVTTVGCVHHHHHDDEAVVYEPAPATYVYEPGYYDRGYYRDNDWYWRDRGGHYYRESREAHERREHEWREHHH